MLYFVYISKCGIQMTQTVIAQLSKAQVSNLVVVRSSQFRSIFLHTLANTYRTYLTTGLIVYFVCFGLALPNRSLHAFDDMACTKTDPIFGLVVRFFYQTTFDHKSREFQLTRLFARLKKTNTKRK